MPRSSLPGKVQRINLKIAPDLSRPDLSFVQVPHGRLNRAGWYLYKHSLEPADIIGRAPLEYNGYISKLVSWAYFNGLLTPQSRVHLFNQGSDLHIDNLHQFCRDLSGTFPVKYPAPPTWPSAGRAKFASSPSSSTWRRTRPATGWAG